MESNAFLNFGSMGETLGVSEKEWAVDLTRLVRWVFWACLMVNGVILVLDIGQHLAEIWYFEHIKDLSNALLENSFGTWFSVVLNAAVGSVALAVSLCCRKTGKETGKALAWGVIGLFFFYVSLDDHLVLHERLAGGLGRVISRTELAGSFQFVTYEWIYLFVPLFGLFGLFMLGFLFRELKGWGERGLLVLALGLWVLAVGLDAWEGAGLPYEGMEAATGMARVKVRHAVMLVEEMAELMGSTLFLYLFLRRLRTLLTERPTVLRLVA